MKELYTARINNIDAVLQSELWTPLAPLSKAEREQIDTMFRDARERKREGKAVLRDGRVLVNAAPALGSYTLRVYRSNTGDVWESMVELSGQWKAIGNEPLREKPTKGEIDMEVARRGYDPETDGDVWILGLKL